MDERGNQEGKYSAAVFESAASRVRLVISKVAGKIIVYIRARDYFHQKLLKPS